MKIVKNSCYGGFGLSIEALARLSELQGRKCYFFTSNYGKDHQYKPLAVGEKTEACVFSFDIPNPNDVDYKKLWDEHNIESRPDDRTDKFLIQVVEELGKKANGDCANLEVVEIPDDLDWEIDEYDGIETIREKHRSW